MTSMMVEMTKPGKQAPCEPMKARESQSGPQIATSQGEPARRGNSQKEKFVPNLSGSLWLSLACCVVWLYMALSGSLARFPALPGSLRPSLDLAGSLCCSSWFYVVQTLAPTGALGCSP